MTMPAPIPVPVWYWYSDHTDLEREVRELIAAWYHAMRQGDTTSAAYLADELAEYGAFEDETPTLPVCPLCGSWGGCGH